MDHELLERFLDSRPNEPDDKEAFLKLSALRWCSDWPVDTKMSLSDSLEAKMDHFIDQWLYFLPIPRYAREYFVTNADLGRCINLSLEALDFQKAKHGPVSCAIAYECFQVMWPHVSTLRDSRLSMESSSLLLCLMAIDPLACLSLDPKTVFTKSFPIVALEAIQEDVTIKSDVLLDVHEYLVKRRLSKYLSDCPDYVIWHEAQERGLTSPEIDLQVQAYLHDMSRKTGLACDILKVHVALKNFIDEVPDIKLVQLIN
jgi:hypothetical protein